MGTFERVSRVLEKHAFLGTILEIKIILSGHLLYIYEFKQTKQSGQGSKGWPVHIFEKISLLFIHLDHGDRVKVS